MPIDENRYNIINKDVDYFYVIRSEGLFNKTYTVNLIIRTSKDSENNLSSSVFNFEKVESFENYNYYISTIYTDLEKETFTFRIDDIEYVLD